MYAGSYLRVNTVITGQLVKVTGDLKDATLVQVVNLVRILTPIESNNKKDPTQKEDQKTNVTTTKAEVQAVVANHVIDGTTGDINEDMCSSERSLIQL